jgi:DNA (cytosine-5)-methyltransferase 1
VGFDEARLSDEPSKFEWPEAVPLVLNMKDIWECETCDREIGYTLRVGGRCSPYGDRHNWDQYMVDGEVKTLGAKQGLMMQGFPAHHILSPVSSRAMKQLGNSVAVSVVKAIGEKMLEYMEKENE